MLNPSKLLTARCERSFNASGPSTARSFMWNDWLKRTHVSCQARCSSRQFVNSGGTPGKTFAPVCELLSSSTGFLAVASRSSRLRLGPTLEGNATRIVDAARQSTALDGVGDVREVCAHRQLGFVRATGDHGLDDRRVLGKRRRRSTGDQDGAVLVPHRLCVQAPDEADSGAVARELEESGMQVGVGVGRAQQVTVLEELALTGETRVKTNGARIVDARGGPADREALEDGTCLQDLDRLLVADAPHASASMRLANDEPVLLQTNERRAHRAARHLECRRDVCLDEAGAGRDVAADDRLTKGVVARDGRHCRHGYAGLLQRSSTILYL